MAIVVCRALARPTTPAIFHVKKNIAHYIPQPLIPDLNKIQINYKPYFSSYEKWPGL